MSNDADGHQTGSVPIAMGVGCRRDCPPEVLMQLATRTLEHAGLHPSQITLVATLDGRQFEMAMTSLAETYGCPLMALAPDDLRASEAAMSQISDTTTRLHGVPGVAEAAALAAIRAHCGEPARLLVPRQQSERATCALAVPNANTNITR